MLRLGVVIVAREFQGSTPGCPGLDPHVTNWFSDLWAIIHPPLSTEQGVRHVRRCAPGSIKVLWTYVSFLFPCPLAYLDVVSLWMSQI